MSENFRSIFYTPFDTSSNELHDLATSYSFPSLVDRANKHINFYVYFLSRMFIFYTYVYILYLTVIKEEFLIAFSFLYSRVKILTSSDKLDTKNISLHFY